MFISDVKIECKCFSIGYLSKVEVEIVEFVVGEFCLERTGDDYGCCGSGKAKSEEDDGSDDHYYY